jgi:hypothetical protein
MANAVTPQQTYTAILRHFMKEGRAPHHTELAGILDVSVAEARQAQHDAADNAFACFFTDGTDNIGAWPPFSNVPNQHRVSVDGVQKWYGQ